MKLPGDTVGLLEGIITTRTIRRFSDVQLPEEALATMLFAATRAPSMANSQPFRFIVLRNSPCAAGVQGSARRGGSDGVA